MTEREGLIASSTSATVHWILRVAVAACFIGHGAVRPLAGESIWEFIERGGSYGAPLALAWIQGWRRTVGANNAL